MLTFKETQEIFESCFDSSCNTCTNEFEDCERRNKKQEAQEKILNMLETAVIAEEMNKIVAVWKATKEETIQEIQKVADNYSDWRESYCDSFHHNLICMHCGYTLHHRLNSTSMKPGRCPNCLSMMGEKTVKALKEAINALQKQIPAEPHIRVSEVGCIDGRAYTQSYYVCPDCEKVVSKTEHHCNCGKALNWEEIKC